jgi:hypothetical protein
LKKRWRRAARSLMTHPTQVQDGAVCSINDDAQAATLPHRDSCGQVESSHRNTPSRRHLPAGVGRNRIAAQASQASSAACTAPEANSTARTRSRRRCAPNSVRSRRSSSVSGRKPTRGPRRRSSGRRARPRATTAPGARSRTRGRGGDRGHQAADQPAPGTEAKRAVGIKPSHSGLPSF